MTDPEDGHGYASETFKAMLSQAGDQLFERCYAVGGKTIRLRVLGAALADQIDRPLQQLRVTPADNCDPAMRIDVWDSQAIGGSPYLGELQDPAGPYGQVTLSQDGRYCGEQRDHSALWLDRAGGHIVGCYAGLAACDLDERARPFNRYFAIWLAPQGIQSIHAGLVSQDRNGLLFVGSGGTGKTTSSISSFLAGFGYLGDDFVGIEQRPDGQFKGHGLYSSCLVNNEHVKRFPALSGKALPSHHAHDEKSVVYLAALGIAQMKHEAPVSGIVMPRIVGSGKTGFRRARKAETLLRMAPSSIMSLPIVVENALDRLSSLVEAVPCFWLDLGGDINDIPTVVGRIFDEAAAPVLE